MTEHNPISKTVLYAALIMLAGFALRFVTITAPYNTDERKNIVIASDLGWGNLAMEDPYVTHPLLNVYVTRLGMSIFDQSKFGVRFLHLVFGTLTLVLVFLLAREIGEKEGLLAVTLLAFNQFHIHASVRAENMSLLFFLLTLAIFLFYRAVVQGRSRYIYWLGPVMGLAFLTKGVTLLLAFGFFLFMVSSKIYRAWFRRRELWITVGLFVVTIVPWLVWVMFHGTSQLIFNGDMYALEHLRPHWTAVNFYLIQLLAWLRGWDYRLLISWEYGILDAVSGVVLLAGTLGAVFLEKHELKRLMLWIFAAFVGVLSFFSAPGLPWGEFWWAAPSLIPAVCLTAAVAGRLTRKSLSARAFIALFLFYAMINSVRFVATVEKEFAQPPHRRATFVDTDYIVAKIHFDKGRVQAALDELDRLRWLTPNDVILLNYTGSLLWRADHQLEAVPFWLRAYELEPDFPSADNYLNAVHDELQFYLYTELAQDPDDLNIRYLIGALAHYYGDEEKAEKELTLVTQINPFHHRAQLFLGLTYFRQANYGKAIAAFKAVLESHPHNERAHYHLGRVYQELGQDEKAIEHFEAAVTLNPDDAQSRYELSQLYQGQPTVAEPQWKTARRIYHQDIKYKYYDEIGGRYRALFKP